MPTLKDKVIDEIIRIEGGYVNDDSDSGGATNFGITEAVAHPYFNGDMRDLPREVAVAIYTVQYWDKVRGDDLARLSEAVAAEVVDTGVNMGTLRAGKFLQRALNVLNDREKLYQDIKVDGNIGSGTIQALTTLIKSRNDMILIKMLNCLQGAFYVELAEQREKDEKFIYGWFKNRVL